MTTGQAVAYNLFESLKETTDEQTAIDMLNRINDLIIKNPEKVKKITSKEFRNKFDDGKPFSALKATELIIYFS